MLYLYPIDDAARYILMHGSRALTMSSVPLPVFFHCGRFQLALDHPLIMGIVNATPDSFSDRGGAFTHQATIAHAMDLLAQGADLIDIGGESTRPGAQPVDAGEEWQRIAPVLSALRDCGVPLSVDTFKPDVMRRALAAGADMINDISGFRQTDAMAVVAKSSCGVCVMHMQGEPRTMQDQPQYTDVVAEVSDFLQQRAQTLQAVGVAAERIVLDPGFGFGKTVQHNYVLLKHLNDLRKHGLPLLVGVSRKSMIGALVNRPASARVSGSIAAALAALARGARILRVHDVAATRDAVAVWQAIEDPSVLDT